MGRPAAPEAGAEDLSFELSNRNLDQPYEFDANG
jgi:hypothetical protein